MPEPGVFHNCLIVSIHKRYPKHAQKVMNAIWGAHLLSLTKLIVVVDDDCDLHDYAEVAFRAFGNVDYAHDLVVTPGPGRPPRPRVVPAVLGRQGGHRRDPQAARPRATPRLAGGDGHVTRRSWPRSTDAGRSTGCDGCCDRCRPAPNPVKAFLRLVDDRALGLRAAVRLPGRADRDDVPPTGSTGATLLLITIAMVGARTFAMAANRILDRQIDARNPRTADAGTRHRRGLAAHRLDRRRSSRSSCSSVAAAAAQPAVPGAGAARGGPAGRLPVRASGSPTCRTRSSALAQLIGPVGAWLARHRHAGRLRAGLGARRRGRPVDRRLRPDLRLPGRRGRPRDRRAQRAGPVRRAVRAVRRRRSRTW